MDGTARALTTDSLFCAIFLQWGVEEGIGLSAMSSIKSGMLFISMGPFSGSSIFERTGPVDRRKDLITMSGGARSGC